MTEYIRKIKQRELCPTEDAMVDVLTYTILLRSYLRKC